MKKKSNFSNNSLSHSTKELPIADELNIPEEKAFNTSVEGTIEKYDSIIKNKASLDSANQSKSERTLFPSKTIFVFNHKNEQDSNKKPPINKTMLSKAQTVQIAEKEMKNQKSIKSSLNYKNEKFIEESLQHIKIKLDENLKDFEKKLNHEILIISFLEDSFPILESMRTNQKNQLFAVYGFVLSKYLFARATFIKFSLEKEENFLQVEDWNMVKINALLSKKIETFAKKQTKYEDLMRNFLKEITDYKPKDPKFQAFFTENIDFFEEKERVYKKAFLLVFMSISEYLEKGKKHGASKYCYAFILRMYQFLIIYNEVGFFKMDLLGNIETKDFQENLIKLDVEEIKQEVIRIFKSIY